MNKSWFQAKYYLERYLLPRYGTLPVRQLTRKKVKKVLGPIEEASHIHDRNRTKAYGHAMWNWAMEQDKSWSPQSNPWSGIKNLEEKARDHVIRRRNSDARCVG